jgi:uncharacterized protein (DUF927 family)
MDNILNSPITIEEIKTVFKGLKNGKSSGIDRVINEYIKYTIVLYVFFKKLFKIFQNSLLLIFDVVLSSFSSLN